MNRLGPRPLLDYPDWRAPERYLDLERIRRFARAYIFKAEGDQQRIWYWWDELLDPKWSDESYPIIRYLDEHNEVLDYKPDIGSHSLLRISYALLRAGYGKKEFLSREANQERFHKIWAWNLGPWDAILKRADQGRLVSWPKIPTALFPDEISKLQEKPQEEHRLIIKLEVDEKGLLREYEAFFVEGSYPILSLFRVFVSSYPNVKEPGKN